MTEPRATYDAGTFPTQPVGSARREIEILVSGAIDLFTEYRERHHAADLHPDQECDEWVRAKVIGEVMDSLEAPSPTLAAMLAADELVAVLHDVQANLRTQAGIRQLATGRAAEMVLESSARSAVELLARIDAVLAKAEATS